MLLILVVYRLLSPGSEWRLHREWYGRSALPDLLGMERVIDDYALYDCHDLLLEHKEALFDHLVWRWRDLFSVSFDVLLYDLTSTYFEIDPPLSDEAKRQFGYSRDKRPDCVQVLVSVEMAVQGASFGYWLNRRKLREVRRREGRYLLRTNLTGSDPAKLWEYYIQLVKVEAAFKTLKGDLSIRPVFHQKESRIEAHIFIAFSPTVCMSRSAID